MTAAIGAVSIREERQRASCRDNPQPATRRRRHAGPLGRAEGGNARAVGILPFRSSFSTGTAAGAQLIGRRRCSRLYRRQHDWSRKVQRVSASDGVRDSFDQDSAEKAFGDAYRVAEEVTNSGVWTLQLSSGRQYWSPNVFRLHGLDPHADQPDVEFGLSLAHPADRARLDELMPAALQEREPQHFRYRIVLPGGAIRHLQVRVVRKLEGEGGPILIGMVNDATAEHQARRDIDLHIAVAEALSAWNTFPEGALGLLARLGEALGFVRGILWLPAADHLVAGPSWEAITPEAVSPQERQGALRMRRGEGLAGRAWVARQPITSARLGSEPGYEFRAAAKEQGLEGAIAIPAVHGGVVHAVIGIAGEDPLELTDRSRETLNGIGLLIGAFLSRRMVQGGGSALTARELEILQLAADGHAGPEIARLLFLSPATVKTHFEHVYAKYGVSDRVAAVARALREGLIR